MDKLLMGVPRVMKCKIIPNGIICWNSNILQTIHTSEIWYNPKTKRFTTIPNHSGDMQEGTLRAILKQANINTESFLQI